MIDWLIFAIIYLIAFGIQVRYIVTHEMTADRLTEYGVYHYIHHGKVLTEKALVHKEALGSCLLVTMLPYYIAKLFHMNERAVFRFLPCFFYSLMPAFVYLIARLYLDVPLSIISAAFILSGFQFLYYPDIGRIGVAQGLVAVVLWCLLSGHILIAALIAPLLVLSHYGSSYFAVSSLGISCVILIFATTDILILRAIFLVTLVAGVSTYIWHFVAPIPIKGLSLNLANAHPIGLAKGTALLDPRGIPYPRRIVEKDGRVRVGTPADAAKDRLHIIFNPRYRDPAFQVACGRTLESMNTPQRMEFVVNWVIIILITLGLAICKFEFPYVAIACGMCLTIFLAVMKPAIGAYYASIRVYFASLTLLAPCFVVGASWLSRVCGLLDWVLPMVIVVVYGMCVSGAMHLLFGINKRRR